MKANAHHDGDLDDDDRRNPDTLAGWICASFPTEQEGGRSPLNNRQGDRYREGPRRARLPTRAKPGRSVGEDERSPWQQKAQGER